MLPDDFDDFDGLASSEPTWTMRDGRKIAIGDMTDGHLVNTIRLIERQRRDEDPVRYVYAGTRGVRQDLLKEIPMYKTLMLEALARKLDVDTWQAPPLKTKGTRINARLRNVKPWNGTSPLYCDRCGKQNCKEQHK